MAKVNRHLKAKQPGYHALAIVRKYFPNVTSVEDAKEPIEVEVTARDSSSAAVRNHDSCAMAVACKRATKASGVIVSMDIAYVIKGNDAIRYNVPQAVQREIVSFDRESKVGFAPGVYKLNVVDSEHKLGVSRSTSTESGKGKPRVHRHITSGIRTVLGSDVVR